MKLPALLLLLGLSLPRGKANGISLTRRLSDLVAVETTIKGAFKDEFSARFNAGGSGTIAHDFPYLVTRSIEIER